MKITELISVLKKLPPDSEILVQGYEDGYDDILDIKEVNVAKHPKEKEYGWNGEFEQVDSTNKDSLKVIVILGNRR